MAQLKRRKLDAHILLAGVFVLTVTMASGCTRTAAGVQGSPNAIVVSPVMQAPPPPAGDTGLRGKPEDNPNATRNYLLSLGWGDNLPANDVIETQVQYGNTSALIRIVPMLLASEVSWQRALGTGNGHFVAKIYNLEDKAIGPLGIGPLGTGYLWVGQVAGAPNQRGAAIYSIRNNGVVEGNPKKLPIGGYCAEPHAGPRVMMTDGKKCPGPFAPSRSAVNREVRLASTGGFEPFAPRGLWVTCSGGCCEVQLTDLQ